MNKALFKGRDWITTQEWTDAELDVLLDVAGDLKRKFKGRVPHRYLADQTIFLMFFDKSTRTRNSFEAGMTQLGGHAHFLTADVMQVSHGESPKDTGIILSSYGHAIAIRHDLVPGEGNAYMREVAKWADAPVINMQCDVDHPCQTIADLMTIRELWEEYGVMIDPHTADGLKVGLEQRRPSLPLICLETALPAKFAETIQEALGREPERPAALEGIEKLPQHFDTLPPDVAQAPIVMSAAELARIFLMRSMSCAVAIEPSTSETSYGPPNCARVASRKYAISNAPATARSSSSQSSRLS